MPRNAALPRTLEWLPTCFLLAFRVGSLVQAALTAPAGDLSGRSDLHVASPTERHSVTLLSKSSGAEAVYWAPGEAAGVITHRHSKTS